MLAVSSVDLQAGYVQLEDGQRLPVTNWICGQAELPGPDGALAVVAGPDADGQWWCAAIIEEDRD